MSGDALVGEPQKQAIAICSWAARTDVPEGALTCWGRKRSKDPCHRVQHAPPTGHPAGTRRYLRSHGRTQTTAAGGPALPAQETHYAASWLRRGPWSGPPRDWGSPDGTHA
jgi:hypothetical protein